MTVNNSLDFLRSNVKIFRSSDQSLLIFDMDFFHGVQSGLETEGFKSNHLVYFIVLTIHVL